jgi:hypothetical protein
MASGWARHPSLVRAASEAGVTVLAGTDSVGGADAPHGQGGQERLTAYRELLLTQVKVR